MSQSVLIFEPFGAKPRKDGFIPTSDRAALPKHYHLLLKKNAPRKNGSVPVMCRITIAQFSCKCYIHPDLWDIKSNRARGKSTVALETNRFLDKIRVGDIALKELTPAFITDFDIFLRTEKQCCNNTTWIYTMPLRRMIAIALNRGWISVTRSWITAYPPKVPTGTI